MAAFKPSAIGEVDLELEGVVYRLRPSFAAIAEIEKGSGKSLFELLRAIEQASLTLDDIGIIVAACIRADAQVRKESGVASIRPARAGELVYGEDGGALLAVRAALHPLLFNALTGGYTALGERKAQTTKTT